MASIYKRTNKNGSTVWRAVIRIKGHPSVSNHFERKQEAKDWAKEVESKIQVGKYKFGQEADRQRTLSELITRYIDDGVIGRHKAERDTIRQLSYFRDSLGSYALGYLTPEILINERKRLIQKPTPNGKSRNPATINRYFATLSGAFTYACKNLRWIDDNPCTNLLKLPTKPKQRRVLNQDEEQRLLLACKVSTSPYLYPIVLIGITTGARKSEILGLKWDDIDFTNKIAHIRDSKNGRPRQVGLVDSVIDQLKSLTQSRDPKKPLVFASKTAFGRVDIKKAWLTALQKTGIENFVFHGLRHHFCTIGGQVGATSSQLRSQLGHTTAAMTDHYSHLDAQSTRFIGESIEKRILKSFNIEV